MSGGGNAAGESQGGVRSPDIATRQTDDGHERRRVWSRLISVTGGDQRSQYGAGGTVRGETGCDGSKGRGTERGARTQRKERTRVSRHRRVGRRDARTLGLFEKGEEGAPPHTDTYTHILCFGILSMLRSPFNGSLFN